ncbi:MAG: TetR/AcrR family transcriptional regulator, partial [Nevskiales bacterium]
MRTSFSADLLSGGMGQYMLRDLQRGVASGRFKITDPLMAFASVGGTVMGAITAQIEFAPKGS